MKGAFSSAAILASALALAVGQAAAQGAGAAQRQQALELQQQGKIPEAEAAWRAYLKTHPSNPEPYAQLGILEARQGHYKDAIPLYRKALALDPRVPSLRLNLGLALFKDGQLKQSIPEFTELLKAAPADSADAQRLNILIGMAHYGEAQYADAVPYLKTAAAHDPSSLPLRLTLAHSCLWSRQFQCVMDVYRQILDLNAESAEAYMLAGEALDGMKDDAGAVAQFRAAEAANPKEPGVHFGLGYLLWAHKHYPDAAVEFEAELANDPGYTQATLYLGDCDLQLNKPAEARPLLEKAIAADPTLWRGHLDLGILDAEAGNNQAALRELEISAKQNPDDVNVHWRLGRLYRAMGRTEDARAEMEKASKLNKQADEALFQKIANGRQHPPDGQTAPQAATPGPGQAPPNQ